MGQDAAFQPGEMVPGSDFQVIRPLGEGGMGSVYEVEDISVGRRFVLKTIHLNLLNRKDLLARFQREARILARLNHPNIVEVITFKWTTDDTRRCYYVMEKLDGRNLRRVLADGGPLGIDQALSIAINLFEAIDHAHGHGVIHRDIKPENIFIHKTHDGLCTAKLLDFGVMKLVEGESMTAGRFLGTVRYAAPEQLTGLGADKKSDLYAAGLVLFEMLAGHGPFDRLSGHAIVTAHLTTVPDSVSSAAERPLPHSLDRLVASLLHKKLEARPARASDVAHALREIRRDVRQASPPTTNDTAVDLMTPSVGAMTAEKTVISFLNVADDSGPSRGGHGATVLDLTPSAFSSGTGANQADGPDEPIAETRTLPPVEALKLRTEILDEGGPVSDAAGAAGGTPNSMVGSQEGQGQSVAVNESVRVYGASKSSVAENGPILAAATPRASLASLHAIDRMAGPLALVFAASMTILLAFLFRQSLGLTPAHQDGPTIVSPNGTAPLAQPASPSEVSDRSPPPTAALVESGVTAANSAPPSASASEAAPTPTSFAAVEAPSSASHPIQQPVNATSKPLVPAAPKASGASAITPSHRQESAPSSPPRKPARVESGL